MVVLIVVERLSNVRVFYYSLGLSLWKDFGKEFFKLIIVFDIFSYGRIDNYLF